MKRRGMWIMLALAIAILAAGCYFYFSANGAREVSAGAPAGGSAEQPAAQPEEERAEEQSEEEQPEGLPEEQPEGEQPTEQPSEQPEERFSPPAEMDETVLVDDDRIAVTVLSYDPEGDMGPEFAVRLENRTDEELYFSLYDASINDVMVEPVWGASVAAHAEAESEICWFAEDLSFTGINYIQEVEGTLRAYGDGGDAFHGDVSWRVNVAETDIPPAVEAEFPGGIDDIDLVESHEYVVTIKAFGMDGAWGPSLVYHLENRTGAAAMFCMESVTVNGRPCQPLWSPEVGAEKTAYSHCDWFEADVQAAQVGEFETLEFTLTIMNPETGARVWSEPVKVSLKGSGELLELGEVEIFLKRAPKARAQSGRAE